MAVKNRTKINCLGCGIEFEITNWQIGVRKFCNMRCYKSNTNKSSRKHMHDLEEGYYASWVLKFNMFRSNARKRHITTTLTFKEWLGLSVKNCYFCNEPPREWNVYKVGYLNAKRRTVRSQPDFELADKMTIYSNGIDRMDNDKYYTLDNCVPCCQPCNMAKNDKPVGEYLSWVYKIYHNLYDENGNLKQ